jgi:hypothetical protein
MVDKTANTKVLSEAIMSKPPNQIQHKIGKTDNRTQSLDALIRKGHQITGSRTTEVADRTFIQVANALVWPKPKGGADDLLRRAIASISELAPQNATEAMLATQMIAVHEAALMFLHQATVADQYVAVIDANVLRATRLMRVFGEQLEAMQRLRGKSGQQRVTVEHVHVNDGGQAIVGSVSTKAPRGGDDNGNR